MKQSEDFYKMGNYEDKIYSLSETVTGQTQTMSQAVQKTLENNDYGLLYDAAVAWKELTEYYYVFTFGYKQQQPIDN